MPGRDDGLTEALSELVGATIGCINMYIDRTMVAFDTGLAVTYDGPANYDLPGEAVRLAHGERTMVFARLAQGYGKPVAEARLLDEDGLRIAFQDGPTFTFGAQGNPVDGEDRLEVDHPSYGRFVFTRQGVRHMPADPSG